MSLPFLLQVYPEKLASQDPWRSYSQILPLKKVDPSGPGLSPHERSGALPDLPCGQRRSSPPAAENVHDLGTWASQPRLCPGAAFCKESQGHCLPSSESTPQRSPRRVCGQHNGASSCIKRGIWEGSSQALDRLRPSLRLLCSSAPPSASVAFSLPHRVGG